MKSQGGRFSLLSRKAPARERFEWNEQCISGGRLKSSSASRARPSTSVSHGDCVAWPLSFKTRLMSSRSTKRIFLRCLPGSGGHRATSTGADFARPRWNQFHWRYLYVLEATVQGVLPCPKRKKHAPTRRRRRRTKR